MLELDHIYVMVQNLDKAIEFYEILFSKKITNREGDTDGQIFIPKTKYTLEY